MISDLSPKKNNNLSRFQISFRRSLGTEIRQASKIKELEYVSSFLGDI